VIAHVKLVASISKSATADRMHREPQRGRMRVLVKRLICKCGYPPNLQDNAVAKGGGAVGKRAA
jgi:type I restriction enzyme R subunit